MATVNLIHKRVGNDIKMAVQVLDNGVALDWTSVTRIYAALQSDSQRIRMGMCRVDGPDSEDPTKLLLTYPAKSPQYAGVARLVLECNYMGSTATLDTPAFVFVASTAEEGTGPVTVEVPASVDPETNNLQILVADVDTSVLDDAIQAANDAADAANEAADNANESVAHFKGGSTGQVLTKKSGADYDFEWQNAGGMGDPEWGNITGTLDDQTDLKDALDAKYEKPIGGIPAADIASGVIPTVPDISTDITTDASSDTKTASPKAVKTFVEGKGYGTYSKPSGGIPSSDLSSAVQTSLGKADTAYQKPSDGVPKSDLASSVQTSLGKADSAYQKPSGGVPKSDLASGVQDSLDLADSAIQGVPVGGITPPAEYYDYATKVELDELGQKIFNKIPFASSVGAIKTADGTTQDTPSSRRRTDYIDISGISNLLYARGCTAGSSATYIGLAFYDSSKNFISGKSVQEKYNQPESGYELHVVAVPDTAVYARFTYWGDEKKGLFFLCDADADSIAREYAKILSDRAAITANKDLIDSMVHGYQPDCWFSPSDTPNGTPTPQKGYIVTDYVKVMKGSTLTWNFIDNGAAAPGQNGFRLAIYDSSKNYINFYTATAASNGCRVMAAFCNSVANATDILYVRASFAVQSVKEGACLMVDGRKVWEYGDVRTDDLISALPDFNLGNYIEDGCVSSGVVVADGRYYRIPASAGDIYYIRYKTSNAWWYFFTDEALVEGSAPPLVPGTAAVKVSVDDGWHRVVVPTGTSFLAVGYEFSSTSPIIDHTPYIKKAEPQGDSADADLCIVPIDIAQYPTSSWMINSQGNWAVSGTNVLVPITPGEQYKVVANDNYKASIAILAEDSFPSTSQAAVFATGYSDRVIVGKNSEYVFTAPVDAETILIRLIDGSNNNIAPTFFQTLTSAFLETLPTDDALLVGTFNSSFNQEDVTATKEAFCDLFAGKDTIESFLFFTDPHLSPASRYEGITELVRDKYISAVQKYYNSLPEDNCICGGDLLNYHDTNAEACEELGYFDGYMRKLFKNYRPCFGNHDFAPYSTDRQLRAGLTNTEVRNLWFRQEKETYYSFDGENMKFYVLNSGPSYIKTMTSYDTPNYAPTITGLRWEQVDWFAKKLLADDAANSAIVMHMYSNGRPASNDNPATWYDDDTSFASPGYFYFAMNIREVAIAYNNRTGITRNGQTYDFSLATGHVLFFLCGHSHFDYVDTSMELPVITTTNLEGGVWNPATGEVDYALVPTFDNVLVDITNSVFYAVRVGAGANRIVNLEPEGISVGDSLTLTTQLEGTITWSSRNTDKATVSSGVVLGVEAGIAEILATNEDGELEQWCVKVS